MSTTDNPRLLWPTESNPPLVMAGRYRKRDCEPPMLLHCHDFFEFFWVEKGQGVHHVNGRYIRVQEGDIVFIRPNDVHAHVAEAGQSWEWTNVGISRQAMSMLRRRYEKDLDTWPWRADLLPLTVRRTPADVAVLRDRMAQLPVNMSRRLDMDWLLSEVLRLVQPQSIATRMSRAPQWLEDALTEFAEPTYLAAGVGQLVELTGRCAEHVNRCLRKHYGMTTTQLVTHLRLEQAARELRLTNKPILTIADDVGFDNLSYFYRRFRSQYGMTPRRFRLLYE